MGGKPSRAAPIDPYTYDQQLPASDGDIAMTFNKIDSDGDHGLTADEWKEGLAKAGIEIDSNRELFASLKTPPDSQICAGTARENSARCALWPGAKLARFKTEVKVTFDSADKDHDGKISQEEFCKYCKLAREKAKHPKVDAIMIKEVMANGIFGYLGPREIAHGAPAAAANAWLRALLISAAARACRCGMAACAADVCRCYLSLRSQAAFHLKCARAQRPAD